jgi:hypothetical protein
MEDVSGRQRGADRRQRLAEALRVNLLRRKTQQRERRAASAEGGPADRPLKEDDGNR